MNSHLYRLEAKYVIVEVGHKLKFKSFLFCNSTDEHFFPRVINIKFQGKSQTA